MQRRVLVVPAYNEERTIIHVLAAAHPLVDLTVVVDDGSTDRSAQLVREWSEHHPGVVLLSLRRNRGKSGALLAGFAYVLSLRQSGLIGKDDLVINMDADGQHRAEEIPVAVAALAAGGADLLVGRRDLSGYPRFKQVGNWGLSLWASLLSGYRYHDVECGFRLLRVEALADMLQYYTGLRYACDQEIGVITALRGWKVDNRFPLPSTYYRSGARARDGIVNVLMGLLAFCRVRLGIRSHIDRRVQTVLGELAEERL